MFAKKIQKGGGLCMFCESERLGNQDKLTGREGRFLNALG